MHFLYKNITAMYFALAASLMAWLYGGIDSVALEQVAPWVLLFSAEFIAFFPQRRDGETTIECRERVWGDMKKDPVVWTCVVLMILLAIPFVNNGLCVNCDRAVIAQGVPAEPPLKFLPFCVNRVQHYNVFLWFAVALSTMVGVKHALNNKGKLMFLKCVVWNGFLLAILGFVQIAAEAPGPLWRPFVEDGYSAPYFFSTFGYSNTGGDYFVTIFGLAIACWRVSVKKVSEEIRTDSAAATKLRHTHFWRKHLYLVPAVLTFFAAINTLSRSAILMVVVLALVYFLHAFQCFTRKMKRAERLKKGVIAFAVLLGVVIFAARSIPESVKHEVDSIDTRELLDRTSGHDDLEKSYATMIWKEHFLFGCGGWGYIHFYNQVLPPEELAKRRYSSPGSANVHNDYLQFLAEHGFIGFGAMALVFILLLQPIVTYWRGRMKQLRFAKKHELPAKPVKLFVLPAAVFTILTTTLATMVHAATDCPLRSAAVLTLFYSALAASHGFIMSED